jgi:hypothetical protein
MFPISSRHDRHYFLFSSCSLIDPRKKLAMQIFHGFRKSCFLSCDRFAVLPIAPYIRSTPRIISPEGPVVARTGLMSFIIHPDDLGEGMAQQAHRMPLDRQSRVREAGRCWFALPADAERGGGSAAG